MGVPGNSGHGMVDWMYFQWQETRSPTVWLAIAVESASTESHRDSRYPIAYAIGPDATSPNADHTGVRQHGSADRVDPTPALSTSIAIKRWLYGTAHSAGHSDEHHAHDGRDTVRHTARVSDSSADKHSIAFAADNACPYNHADCDSDATNCGCCSAIAFRVCQCGSLERTCHATNGGFDELDSAGTSDRGTGRATTNGLDSGCSGTACFPRDDDHHNHLERDQAPYGTDSSRDTVTAEPRCWHMQATVRDDDDPG